MDYLYQIPDEDRQEEGFIRASNQALREFLALDVQHVPPEKLDDFLTSAWWEYIKKQNLSDAEASALLDKIQTEKGGSLPYSAGWPARFAGLIEETPLYNLESSLIDWVANGNLYWRPADALYARYHWQILQERVHELAATAPDAHPVRLPRLLTAIDWLKGYEQRLAAAQQAQVSQVSPLAWQGSKAELAELGYSLLESGVVAARNRAGAVKMLGELFGIALGDNPAAHLQTIQKRKPGALLTPLLDKLKAAFSGYLDQKTENEALNRASRRR